MKDLNLVVAGGNAGGLRVPWCACTDLAALQAQKEQLCAGNVSAEGQIQASSLLDHLVVLTPFSGGFPKHLCEDAS